jgi:hypothetical protein
MPSSPSLTSSASHRPAPAPLTCPPTWRPPATRWATSGRWRRWVPSRSRASPRGAAAPWLGCASAPARRVAGRTCEQSSGSARGLLSNQEPRAFNPALPPTTTPAPSPPPPSLARTCASILGVSRPDTSPVTPVQLASICEMPANLFSTDRTRYTWSSPDGCVAGSSWKMPCTEEEGANQDGEWGVHGAVGGAAAAVRSRPNKQSAQFEPRFSPARTMS